MPTRIFFNADSPYNSVVVSEGLDTVERMMQNEKQLNGVGVLTSHQSRESDKRIIIFIRNITHARAERVSI